MDLSTQYLRAHAAEHVWIAPKQDRHYILVPARLTSSAGSVKRTKILQSDLMLPDAYSRWHVYQIGGIDPLVFNLFYQLQEWTSLAAAANEQKINVNIYNVNGVEVPRFDSYYCYNQQGALLLAVRINRLIPIDFSLDEISIKLCSNRWWETEEGLTDPTGYEVKGRRIESAGDITAFGTQIAAAAAKASKPFQLQYFLNGTKRLSFVAANVKVGDVVEYVLDGAIYRQERITTNNLQTFESTLDQKIKSLWHLPKPAPAMNGIFPNFRVHDIYVEGTVVNTAGFMLHRGAVSTVRPLTYNDFSLDAASVQRTSRALADAGMGQQISKHTLMILMRRTASEKPMLHEHHYVQELYRLSNQDIIDAMVGSRATVDVWRAANLEKSAYTAVAYAERPCDITEEKIEEGYGYYAMAKVLADSPVKVKNPGATGYIEVPYMLAHGSTMYEYDQDGILLEWHHHYLGSNYYVKNNLCRTVEIVAGLGGQALDELHGVRNVNLKGERNFKVYERTSISGKVQPGFKDVTGSDKYTIDKDTLAFTWKGTDVTSYPTVRSDSKFFSADYEIPFAEGQLRVTLLTLQTHNGVTGAQKLDIPLGQIDVFMNGKSLLRGLEYFYRDGVIYIVATRYINYNSNALQKVHVRFTGFCTKQGELLPEGDIGFIEHGVLSRNNRFDVRDGRVTRIVAAGQLITRDQLAFSEDSDQVAPEAATNGHPYMVRDVWVPLRPYVLEDTWSLIDLAQKKSKEVSDYLTARIPEIPRGDIVTFAQRLPLYSPFLSAIIFDLLYGRLYVEGKTSYTRQEVMQACKNYEHLLEVDPLKAKLDARYVLILPHSQASAVALSLAAYRFVDTVVTYYAEGQVSLTNSVTITTT